MPDRMPPLGKLGFGGANLGNLFTEMSDEQAHAVLQAAWDAGIRYFDTAPHYGLGLAERRLGAFLATKPRDEFVVSTKVGRRLEPSPETSDESDEEGGFVVPADVRRVWDASAGCVRRSLDESLERLGLDRVDVLFLHDPDEYPDMEASVATAVPALVALREEGLVRAVGIGSKSVAAHLAGVRAGDLDLLMVAGRYTLLEQPAAPELIPECRERGIGIAVAGAFNSGLLATSTPGPGARYEYGDAPAEVVEKAQRLAMVCGKYGVELPAAALQFPLREPVVRSVVLGATEPAHIEQNVARIGEPIPEELWEQLAVEGFLP
ncbi:D-threo-aldose 1-dehydrogenase [Pseudonocardia hierapolitana]|uniref:D-threo-aldose 1-dehydrogenase n=1 Tax=Pseudonocardia hierapolitana TaxID=1128676 RepID=A0A561SRW6_9PSEU|nr:aldo/keto reductase [Pseudonocardia hierapolitana]TWF77591.1 D-threo-aldose 1-dehydrogenase [Pseudonocardia hierapolitana]